MKNEEKKRALCEYLEEKKVLAYWEKKVEEYESLDLYRSPAITAMPAGTGSGNPIEIAVVELETARENKRAAVELVAAALKRVTAIIQTAPTADERIVLMQRYIDGMDWEQIAEAAGKSRTWATNTHGTAIKNIAV